MRSRVPLISRPKTLLLLFAEVLFDFLFLGRLFDLVVRFEEVWR